MRHVPGEQLGPERFRSMTPLAAAMTADQPVPGVAPANTVIQPEYVRWQTVLNEAVGSRRIG